LTGISPVATELTPASSHSSTARSTSRPGGRDGRNSSAPAANSTPVNTNEAFNAACHGEQVAVLQTVAPRSLIVSLRRLRPRARAATASSKAM